MSSQVLSSTGNNSSLPSKPTENVCICSRPKSRIMCRRCGYVLESGRARRPCSCHPKVINLMDMAECPQCRANYIWLQEVHV